MYVAKGILTHQPEAKHTGNLFVAFLLPFVMEHE